MPTAVKNTLDFAVLSVPLTLVLGVLLALVLVRSGVAARSTASWSTSRCSCRASWPGSSGCSSRTSTSGCSTTSCTPSEPNRSCWLGSNSALRALAAVDVWRNVGYWAIFFVAALIGLPQELYQAADLDGAGPLARFWHLTLPLLRRILLFAIVVSTILGSRSSTPR